MLESLIALFARRNNDEHVVAYGPDVFSVSRPPDPESIFREHYAGLFRPLAVALGDSEAAADAVQEAFIQLCLRWRRVQKLEDPARWLRRVALSVLDDNRGPRGHRLSPPSSAATIPSSLQPLSEFRGDIEAALACLSLPERLALVLHYMEDLSAEEIAHAMDISKEDARTYLHRARERLQPNLVPGPWPETMIY